MSDGEKEMWDLAALGGVYLGSLDSGLKTGVYILWVGGLDVKYGCEILEKFLNVGNR